MMIAECVVGVCLYRISGQRLIACEAMKFAKGAVAVNTTLLRASISGRVEVGGRIDNHFADLLDDVGDIVGTVALDRASYLSLKNQWMRCKLAAPEGDTE